MSKAVDKLSKLKDLTLTSVVFEFIKIFALHRKNANLTLTSVVFECTGNRPNICKKNI